MFNFGQVGPMLGKKNVYSTFEFYLRQCSLCIHVFCTVELLFQCKFCGKAFASHAAHDSHVRRTHAREKVNTCERCGKEFSHILDFKLHMRSHDGKHI